MSNDTATVKPGGGYVEDENFVPNAGDLRKQFNTSGVGASGDITETSAVYDLDKAQTAEQVTRALDDDDKSVGSHHVILPDADLTPEEAAKDITQKAKARLKNPVVVGEASPAEKVAAEEGDDDPTKKGAKATDGPRAEGNAAAGRENPQAPAESGGTAKKSAAAKKSASAKASEPKAKASESGNAKS